MRRKRLAHQFVEYVPDKVSDGILYVSLAYNTAVHRCCCGCGNEVVTPISPVDWTLGYDGESVTLKPSIGNYSFECRSHYWITRNRVEWAGLPSQWKIDQDREADRQRRLEYFEAELGVANASSSMDSESIKEPDNASWWRRAIKRFFDN